jgi:hypothetical protein
MAEQQLAYIVYATDGHQYHFRQADGEGLEHAIELLRETKVFSQRNLVFHTHGALVTFPSSAVSRLDIVTSYPITENFLPTWRGAREICGAEFFEQRDAILNDLAAWALQREGGSFPVINSVYSLGGYQTHLLFDITRSEDTPPRHFTDFDVSMIAQHAPPPVYTIHRCDGGVSFLNTATIVRFQRIPGYLVSPGNALSSNAQELIDPESTPTL